jgi:tyrosyl-tRNA synthetase
MSPDEQLELLLRGTLFADEVEGSDVGAGSLADAQAGAGTPARDETGAPRRTLRQQMTAELRERLKEGRPLRVYLGVDPTATSLHIGHLVPVQKLRLFQRLGHQVIFLIGDYTGLIGDPTGQKTERKRFTHDELVAMAADYQRQAFRLLDPERTEVRFNGEWLSRLSFADVVELAAIFPLRWVVSRRDFQERLQRGESLRLHETLYCLMQGYDAHALGCDVQIGGYDQHLNMLSGRWIQEHFGEKSHVIWTYPLLMGTDGRKMSKSFGNAINILDTPGDMYGKAMRISDNLIPSYIDLTSDFEPARADALKARLGQHGVNPMDVKKEVASSLVRQYYGADAAREAAEQFRALVQQKEVPDDVLEIRVPEEMRGRPVSWPDLLVTLEHEGKKLAASKGEIRRLMTQGGFYVEQEPVTDMAALFTPGAPVLIRLGKRRFYRLV